MTHKQGHAMTINVEYNQLGPLLQASGWPEGDVADDTGHSPFPGELLILEIAARTAGVHRDDPGQGRNSMGSCWLPAEGKSANDGSPRPTA